MRALLLGAFAHGISTIKGALLSKDARALIESLRALGAQFLIEDDLITIRGICNQTLSAPSAPLDLGNSGIALRFLSGLLASLSVPVTLTGDASLRKRPMDELICALKMLGVAVKSKEGVAPMTVQGPVHKGELVVSLGGGDSQPVSALLFLGALLDRPLEIHVTHPGEKPWVDLTLSWLERLGVGYERTGYTYYKVLGHGGFRGFNYTVPADLSTLSYPVGAALILGESIKIEGVDFSDPQGDKALFAELVHMGAGISIDESTLAVERTSHLKGRTIDVNCMIDAVPLIATLGCYAKGETRITGAKIARTKECDRLHVMTRELKKMGAQITELTDGLIVRESKLKGAQLHSHQDHRIGMSLALAALGATGPSELEYPMCIEKTFPNFFEELFFSFA